MEFTLKWFALFVIFSIVKSEFIIPEVEIEVLKPKGIRVSIPDRPGIQFTEFFANINKEITRNDLGDIFIRVSAPSNGSWMFIDKDTELSQGDVLHYWVFIQNNGMGYTKQVSNFKVE